MRAVRFAIMIIAVLVLLPAFSASAHTPLFSHDNTSLQTAFVINDPAKSWAVYANLPSTNAAAYYRFQMDAGGDIDITLLSSEDPADSHFLPSFVLMIPGSLSNDPVPSFVDVPTGYGTIMVNGIDPGTATYEPFSPGWFYQLANLTLSAPVTGTYYVAVYDQTNTGNYGLPVGYIEGYTIPEILMLPYDLQLVFVWEGQNIFVVLLPLILSLVLGGMLIHWRTTKGKGAKDDLSMWATAFGSLAFIGYAGIDAYQMIFALTKTGWDPGALVSILFLLLPLALGAIGLRYALKQRAKTTIYHRLALVAIGVVGLMLWTGLYIGPALMVLAAILPSRGPKMP
jgi:hypothetical protein